MPLSLLRRSISSYVERVRLFDHWQLHEESLSREFPRSLFLLVVDRKPLVVRTKQDIQLIRHPYKELKDKLAEYGLGLTLENSCLIDVMDSSATDGDKYPMALFGTTLETAKPPEDSPISHREVRNELAKSLGGNFIDLRMAMLTLGSEQERNWMARLMSLARFALTYQRCPTCTSVLHMRISKSGAECTHCKKTYYPQYSPVAICLIHDVSNEHALLVRHRGSASGVYTCVAGFATPGESLHETCRREIAEEVGIEATDVEQANISQPWPIPDNSLMVGFRAIASRSEQIHVSPDELENAQWFTRSQVREALIRTDNDPFLKGLSKDSNDRQVLNYLPPHGAIAHALIKRWVYEKS